MNFTHANFKPVSSSYSLSSFNNVKPSLPTDSSKEFCWKESSTKERHSMHYNRSHEYLSHDSRISSTAVGMSKDKRNCHDQSCKNQTPSSNGREKTSYGRESCPSFESESVSPSAPELSPQIEIKKPVPKKPRKKYKSRKPASETVEDISALPPQLTGSMLQRRKRVRHPKNPLGEPTRYCKVCGDTAINFNYGIISCESCKAFFRRNAYRFKELFCVRSGDKSSVLCFIDKQTRKNCSACRLVKCFELGMRRDWEEVPGAKVVGDNSAKETNCKVKVEEHGDGDMDVDSNSSVSSQDTQELLTNIKQEAISLEDLNCSYRDRPLESTLVNQKDRYENSTRMLSTGESQSSLDEKYMNATLRFKERYYSVTSCPGPFTTYARCTYAISLMKSLAGNRDYERRVSGTFVADCYSLGLVYDQYFCSHRVPNTIKSVQLGNHDCVLVIVDTLLQKLIYYIKHLSEFDCMPVDEKKSLLMTRFNLVLAILFRQIWNFKIRAGRLITEDGSVFNLNPFEILPLEEGDLVYDEMQVMYEYQNLIEALNHCLPISSSITAIISLLKLFEPQSESDTRFSRIFLDYCCLLKRYIAHLCPDSCEEKWKQFVRWYHYMVEVFDPASNNLLMKLSGVAVNKPPLISEIYSFPDTTQ